MDDLTQEGLAARGLRVKALEWHDAWFEKCASSVAGYHRVFERNGLWRAVIHTRADAYFVAECETEETARAAAQADYAARILAALELDRAALAASPEVQALIREAEARGMERAAELVEGSVYTSNGSDRALEPVKPKLRGMDMHHATIAAAIRAAAAAHRNEETPK